MAIVITERGFAPDDWADREVMTFAGLAEGREPPAERFAVDFPNDRDPAELAPWLDRIEMIRIAFPAMGDGRGFSIARRLRDMGFAGRLRAAGPLVADQMTAARRVGFDEVEVPEEIAARQPEAQWLRGGRGSYQAKLGG